MKWLIYETYEQLSAAAGQIFAQQIAAKPHSVLGLATGETPLGLYACLVGQCQAGALDFAGVTTFNLDEYYPMAPAHPQSYRYFMDKHLFSGINIRRENTFVPDGTAADPAAACQEYEAMIQKRGGIDLQLLGVGRNGHIGFNEPADALTAATHVTDLTESTRRANARFFDQTGDVPRQAVTMGMGTILQARAIVCLISGTDKHPVVQALQDGHVTPACPATFLKLHPNVTVLCERKAYEG